MMERVRWPNGPVCAHCGCVDNISKIKSAKRPGLYRCGDCKMQFTVKVNTVMHDSHLPIRTWLMAFSIMCSAKQKGHQRVATSSPARLWFLQDRVAFCVTASATCDEAGNHLRASLAGEVEVDETYVGGKPRKFAGSKERATSKRGRGISKKVPGLGALSSVTVASARTWFRTSRARS